MVDNGQALERHACQTSDGASEISHNSTYCLRGGPYGECRVVGVNLTSNGLIGPLQENLFSMLTTLQRLELGSNQLSGPLPARWLAQLATMQSLALERNRFDYYESSATELLRLVQRCKEDGFNCGGLPPVSCSAFGSNWMVQARKPDTCEKCGELWVSAMLMAIGGFILLIGLITYIMIISKYPGSLQTFVSTATIILNHLQTISIIALLKLHWPPSVEITTSFFSVDFFEWASTRPECLARDIDEDMEEYGGVALLYTASRVALLLILLQSINIFQICIKRLGRCFKWELETIELNVDRLEMFETVLFSVQLTAALRLGAQLIDSMFTGSWFAVVAGWCGILLLLTQAFFIVKYLTAARSLAIVMHAELDARRYSADGADPEAPIGITAAAARTAGRSPRSSLDDPFGGRPISGSPRSSISAGLMPAAAPPRHASSPPSLPHAPRGAPTSRLFVLARAVHANLSMTRCVVLQIISIAFITTTRCVAPFAVPSILLTTKHQPRPQLEAVDSLLRASCLQ